MMMMKFLASSTALASSGTVVLVAALRMEVIRDGNPASMNSSDDDAEAMDANLLSKQQPAGSSICVKPRINIALPKLKESKRFSVSIPDTITLLKLPEPVSSAERMVFGEKQFPIDEIIAQFFKAAEDEDIFGEEKTDKPIAGKQVYVKVEIKPKKVTVTHKVAKPKKTAAQKTAGSKKEKFLNFLGLTVDDATPEVTTETVTKTPAEVYAEFKKQNVALRAQQERTMILEKETSTTTTTANGQEESIKFYKYVPARIVYLAKGDTSKKLFQIITFDSNNRDTVWRFSPDQQQKEISRYYVAVSQSDAVKYDVQSTHTGGSSGLFSSYKIVTVAKDDLYMLSKPHFNLQKVSASAQDESSNMLEVNDAVYFAHAEAKQDAVARYPFRKNISGKSHRFIPGRVLCGKFVQAIHDDEYVTEFEQCGLKGKLSKKQDKYFIAVTRANADLYDVTIKTSMQVGDDHVIEIDADKLYKCSNKQQESDADIVTFTPKF